jgi:GH43 family beta-xylosidase
MRGVAPPPQCLALDTTVFQHFKKSYLFFLLNDPSVSGVVFKELGQNFNFTIKSEVLRKGQPLSYT